MSFSFSGSTSYIPDVTYDVIRAPYVQYEQAYCETSLVS